MASVYRNKIESWYYVYLDERGAMSTSAHVRLFSNDGNETPYYF